jgi:molybdate transport system ATP-binding protein
MMPALELQSRVVFPGFRLTVDLELPLDGITGLFGPSGSGKSTVLRVIAGLERQSRGGVALAGEVWQDDARGLFTPPHRRGVGYVFQDARLFPHLSVAGNLRYGWRRVPPGERRIAFDLVVDVLELQPLLERGPGSLSGGEAQRVAIGRALLASPRLLLMDEPLSALDHARKAEILPYIERLRDEVGLPVVYVSHAIEEVTRLASSLVLLSEGAVAATGPVQSVMERLDLRPLTGRFEAGAVLDARVIRHEHAYALTVLQVAGHELRVPEIGSPLGSTSRVRIRARDVALSLRRPEAISIRNIIKGTIAACRLEDGPFVEVTVDIGGPLLLARITWDALADLDLRPGQEVFALIKTVAIDRRSLGYPTPVLDPGLPPD